MVEQSSYKCFMAERTDQYRRELRRYVSSRDPNELCPGAMSYHNAVRVFDIAPAGDDLEGNSTVEFCYKNDRHWPIICDGCGYLFRDCDEWQWNQHRLYQRPGTDEQFTLRAAPVGAIWMADWTGWNGPDGHSLVVQTPGGEWMIDGPSSNGDRSRGAWTRTGTPPLITVRPSILMRDYHGFLDDGILHSA
jgi:hypothetical protein